MDRSRSSLRFREDAPLSPRLALVVHSSDRDADDPGRYRRYVERRVETRDGGSTSQELYAGTRAELLDQLHAPQAVDDVARFLERVLPDYDEMIEAEEPLDVPLVAVEREGAQYAVLDPRRTGFQARGPRGDHSAEWRLLLHRGGEWLDAGSVASQWEGERGFLRARVLATVETFDVLSFEGFVFRRWDGGAPEVGAAVHGDEVDRSDPVAARLREVCEVVVRAIPNAEQELGVAGALGEEADHVLEVRDAFDGSYYYVPVPRGTAPEALAAEVGSRSMQEVTRIVARRREPRRIDVAALLEERRQHRERWTPPPVASPAARPGLAARLRQRFGTLFRGR